MAPESAPADPFAALLGERDFGLCLDLASGRGAFLERLAALGTARAWLALDLDPDLLRAPRDQGDGKGREAAAPAVLRLAGDAARPPFRRASLDTVACSFSLHHLPRPARALAAACRLLRPGGRLVLAEPLADGLRGAQRLHRDLHHLAAALDRRSGRFHRPCYRLGELRALTRDLPLSWRWDCWRPPALPPEAEAELEGVRETMARLDGELARRGHADLRRRLAAIRERVGREGWAGQTQWCAVGMKP